MGGNISYALKDAKHLAYHLSTHLETPRMGWNEMKWEFVFPPAGFPA